MSAPYFSAHVTQRWQQRVGRKTSVGYAFARSQYIGQAKLRTRPTRRGRELCFGYQYDRWVFVVAYRPGPVVLTVWPVAWWAQKARQYAHWWAQTYHQQEEERG